MEFHLSMTTCPRKESTIVRSIESLWESGYDGTISVHHDEDKSLGCFRNFHKALTAAIDSGADIVGQIPDDMLFQKGWQKDVLKYLNDDLLGYLALYVPKGLGERYKFTKGINEINGGWASSWGGCYLMPRESAKQLVSHTFYQRHLQNDFSRDEQRKLYNYAPNKRIDHVVPHVMHLIGLKQLYYVPSVCEHIGMKSTIGHKHTDAETAYRP